MKRKTVGKLLRDYRRSRGFSQKDVADFLGISVSYVCDIELGKRNPPSEERLISLAEFFGVSPFDLLIAASKQMGSLVVDTTRISNGELATVIAVILRAADLRTAVTK